MARERTLLFALNGGQVSPLSLARIDLARMKLTAEEYYNCFPRVIGPLQFRPGLKYLSATPSNAAARNLPFIFSADDTALIQLSDQVMRFRIDGSTVARTAVSTAITNGDFGNTTGWTLSTGTGGVANINSTVSGALVLQNPVRGPKASCTRSVTVAGGDQNVEHGIRIIVSAGAVKFRAGTTSGGAELLSEVTLGKGTHSLAVTPTGATMHVWLEAQSETRVIVDSIEVETVALGYLDTTTLFMKIPTDWLAADLFELRFAQSGDVIYVTHDDYHPKRIERRGARSWSLVDYQFLDGPWRGKTANVSLTPSVRNGNGTLTSNVAFFTSSHVGCLFQISHTQTVRSISLAGNDVYTDPVRVSGRAEGTIRRVTYETTGTWNGTITVQQSSSEDGPWDNRTSSSSNLASANIEPGTDNEITFVRLGFQAGEYTSGTAVVTLHTPGGGGTGVVRVTSFTSTTVVNVEVVTALHFTGATEDWQEGKYSTVNGWPSAVELFEGRLWFGGSDQIAGSYSDDFTNFDVEEEGDSAAIIRSVATGPVNKVHWLLGLARLIVGTSGAEGSARSSSFDEPMTKTNFSIKDASTQGSADVAAVKIDRMGVFAQRSGKRAYLLNYSVEAQDYASTELTRYNPTILEEGVKIMAVQRQPDTRIWFCLNDGTAACLVHEPTEDVIAWCTMETDGDIEDICVLPNADADDVYMVVKRNINGSDVRYIEKLSYDTEAQGGLTNYVCDSWMEVTLSSSTSMTGFTHLASETVVVWANGSPVLDANGEPATFVVSGGGVITLTTAVTGPCIAGLAYEGRFKSSKLAYAANVGTPMSQKKQIMALGPLLYNTHNRAILFGHDFTTMRAMPRKVREVDQTLNALLATHDYDEFAIPGQWHNDSRLCMKFRSPLPATVLGIVINVESP